MKTIYFIRHGETTGDIENLYGGDYDDHLTEKGCEEARMLGEKLKEKNIQVIFTSPLMRAQETAAILNSHHEAPVKVDSKLKERNWYGELTGMNKDVAKEKFPELVALLSDRYNTLPGGESYDDFMRRISEALREIYTDEEYERIAVVSHGGAMRVLFRDILKQGEIDFGNCAFTELSFDGDALSLVTMDGITLK
jgi:broad specificity phosphatase PhoE